MTLTEIMVAALNDMERGTDSQTIARHRDSFTLHANEAVRLICERYRPCKKQTLTITNSTINTANLDHTPIRIKSVTVDGSEVDFEQTFDGSGIFTLDGGNATAATADVIYRFSPQKLSNGKDVPEIPTYMHDMIVHYVVACARAGGDPDTQSTSSAGFQLFNRELMEIKPSHLGQPSSRKLKNYY